MRTTLLSLGILSIVIGLMTMGVAKSAVHEIEAYILFLTGAVLISSYGIIGAIDKLHPILNVENNKTDV